MVDYESLGIGILSSMFTQEIKAMDKDKINIREAFERIERVANVSEELGNKLVEFAECVRNNEDFKHLM